MYRKNLKTGLKTKPPKNPNLLSKYYFFASLVIKDLDIETDLGIKLSFRYIENIV